MANSSINFEKQTYFEYDNVRNESKCKVDGCGKILKGNLIYNLRRHIISQHKELAALINLRGNKANNEIGPCELINLSSNKKNSRGKEKIKYNKNFIQKTCVSMCTKRAFPFSVFELPEIKYFLDPYFEKYDVSINSHNIADLINTSAGKIKEFIRNEVKKKSFVLKWTRLREENVR